MDSDPHSGAHMALGDVAYQAATPNIVGYHPTQFPAVAHLAALLDGAFGVGPFLDQLRLLRGWLCRRLTPEEADGLTVGRLVRMLADTAPAPPERPASGRKKAKRDALNKCDRHILKAVSESPGRTGQEIAGHIGYNPDYVRSRLARLIQIKKLRNGEEGGYILPTGA